MYTQFLWFLSTTMWTCALCFFSPEKTSMYVSSVICFETQFYRVQFIYLFFSLFCLVRTLALTMFWKCLQRLSLPSSCYLWFAVYLFVFVQFWALALCCCLCSLSIDYFSISVCEYVFISSVMYVSNCSSALISRFGIGLGFFLLLLCHLPAWLLAGAHTQASLFLISKQIIRNIRGKCHTYYYCFCCCCCSWVFRWLCTSKNHMYFHIYHFLRAHTFM